MNANQPSFASAVLAVALIPFLAGAPATRAENLVLPRDLVYVGAFRMPNDLSSGANWQSGGLGITYRADGDAGGPDDGFPGSLFAIGKQPMVSEVSIPRPVIPGTAYDATALPRGITLQPFADVTGGLRGAVGVDKLGGIAYLPAQTGQSTGRLYWTVYEYYNAAGDNYLSHGMSELNLAHPSPQGAWRLGPASDEDFHSMKTADYVFDIPREWADEHLGGKILASGRHRENGAFGGCQGPAIYAFAPPADGAVTHGAEVDAVCLLRYPTGGGHFPDYCAADRWNGATWIRYGHRSAVLIVGSKGKGPVYYGEGGSGRCSSSKGFHCDPYEAQFLFYNPADLAAVARGERQPWQVLPFATVVPEELWPLCHVRPSCATFDPGRGILYVIEYNGARIPAETGTRIPLVHVWRIQPARTRQSRRVQPRTRMSEGNASDEVAGLADTGAETPGLTDVPTQRSASALAGADAVTISPNPATGSTTIRLAPGVDPATVRVAVHDLSGRLVRELDSNGGNSMTWDAVGVPPGIYFLRVSTADATVTRKISLLR